MLNEKVAQIGNRLKAVLGPDYRIRKALGNIRQVLHFLVEERLSVLVTTRGKQPEATWQSPTYMRVHAILTNHFYAGAYAFGCTRTAPRDA